MNYNIDVNTNDARKIIAMHFNTTVQELNGFSDSEIILMALTEGYGIKTINGTAASEIKRYFSDRLLKG